MEKKEKTWQEYLFILFRRRWVWLLAFLSVMAVTALLTFTAKPVYEAKTSILIDVEERMQKAIFDMMSPLGQREAKIKNQVEILKSRTLALGVLEFVSHSQYHPFFEKLVSDLPAHKKLEQKLAYLKKNLKIQPVRGTDVIELKTMASDPVMASFLANAFADQYYQQSLRFTKGEISEVRQFLEAQLDNIQKELKVSEEALKAYKEKEKVTALPDETSELVKKLVEFDGLYNEAKTDLESAVKRMEYMQSQLDTRRSKLIQDITMVSSPLIMQLRNEIASLEAVKASYIAQGFDVNHPKIIEINQRIEDTKKGLITESSKIVSSELLSGDPLALSTDLVNKILLIEIDIHSLSAKTKALGTVVQTYAAQLNSLPEKSLQLARLERQAKVSENIFIMLKEKYEEVRIKEAGQIGSVRIIDQAYPPLSPIKPKKKLNLILGALLGILFATTMILAAEAFDTTVKTVPEIEKAGIPVLGTIPLIKENNKIWAGNGKHRSRIETEELKISSNLVTHLDPKSAVSEAYRTFRTNLQFTQADTPLKTILVTSPGPSEGKSTTISNLAITLSQSGLKTLVVDTDLRKPVLHGIFGVPKEPGVVHYLSGKADLKSVIKQTPLENIFLIPAGIIPPNPNELIGSQKFKNMVEELKGEFDFVLFDSPPMMVVADATVLSTILDGVVLVISAGQSHLANMEKVATSLKGLKANLLGGVLNKFKFEKIYGGYPYYYYYHHYYGDGKENKSGLSKIFSR